MKIKHKFTGAVLFEIEVPEKQSGAGLRYALEKATETKTNLNGADLTGANLTSSNLSGANLTDADLNDADLTDANLNRANLTGANLNGADLTGANLTGDDGKELPRATTTQAIENLDKVRAIVMDNKKRLNMDYWHGSIDWINKTCAEEVICGTTHCMAGWLQVCTTKKALKTIDAQLAGILAAPVAAKMFYASDSEAYAWLESRAYVEESKGF